MKNFLVLSTLLTIFVSSTEAQTLDEAKKYQGNRVMEDLIIEKLYKYYTTSIQNA
jgi:hypothetical protein